MAALRMDRRRREAARDALIARLDLAGVLRRLALVAPDDHAAIEHLARYRLRRRWPGTQPLRPGPTPIDILD